MIHYTDTTDTRYFNMSDTENDIIAEYAMDERTDIGIRFHRDVLLCSIPEESMFDYLCYSSSCTEFRIRLKETGLSYFVLINFWRDHPNRKERIDFADGLYVIKKVLSRVIHCDFYPILHTKKRIATINNRGAKISYCKFHRTSSRVSLRMTSIFKHPSPNCFGIYTVVNGIIQNHNNNINEFKSHIVDVGDFINRKILAFTCEYGFIPVDPYLCVAFNQINKNSYDKIFGLIHLIEICITIVNPPLYDEVMFPISLPYLTLLVNKKLQIENSMYIEDMSGKVLKDMYNLVKTYDIDDTIYIILQIMKAKKSSAIYEVLQNFKQSRKATYETYHSEMFKLISKIY